MIKLKFAIIGPEKSENTIDLVEEIKKRNFSATVFSLKDLIFSFSDKKTTAKINGKDILFFDIFIFRAFNKNFAEACILAELLRKNGKIIVDEVLTKKNIPSKTYEAFVFSQNKIKHPKIFQPINATHTKNLIKKIKLPVVVKPIYGQKGQGVLKFDNKKSLASFLKNNPKGFLLQEFIPSDGDFRVFVVNKKALGAIKRFNTKSDFRSNASLGAKVIPIKLTRKLSSLAIKAASAMNYEIAGVDIIKNKNSFLVLEVNITPQWQAFKKTGINPAVSIIDYVIKKYEKKLKLVFSKNRKKFSRIN